MRIIKALVAIMCYIGICVGLISLCIETETTAEILTINGGGIAIFCISLLILAWLNKGTATETETKGGKYYGIR